MKTKPPENPCQNICLIKWKRHIFGIKRKSKPIPRPRSLLRQLHPYRELVQHLTPLKYFELSFLLPPSTFMILAAACLALATLVI
ncbi:MAG: hypothetical protein HF976_14200 [ANME-2 cluster archaeon]|nr:hypothetical protein [ANME-2 cluster archaeon]MBC2708872.1 hypothetical protein [ANME-2 cluster archaeon]MBC2761753.1 hypothetical protein [ANME-2 cluster archaeon]